LEFKNNDSFNYHADNIDHLTGKCKDCLRSDRKKRERTRFNPVLTGNKTCIRCNIEKTKDNFLLNKSSADGFNGWCKQCTKDATLITKYGITIDQYTQLLSKQNYKCALCETSNPGGNTNVFVVDHNHITGKIRGLLCNHCNTGLGKLRDSSTLLLKAAQYVDSSVVLE
jgi:hypothetical protein